MSGLPIISADERLAERRGIKGCIFGKSGIGKTSLLWTLEPRATLFFDLEAGDLAIEGWPGDTIRPRTWSECRDFAVFIGGPNPALRDDQVYSRAHYEAVRERFGNPAALDRYETVFIDSITVAGRLCFQWCKGQPQAFSDRNGKPDMRGAYGLHGQEMIAWLTHLQHTRDKNVWFVGILDEKLDDFNRRIFSPQIEGAKTSNELPGIVDEVIVMAEIGQADGEPYRAFVCRTLNSFGYPAKDRSGRLDQIEEPHLGRLMTKIGGPVRPASERLVFGCPTPPKDTAPPTESPVTPSTAQSETQEGRSTPTMSGAWNDFNDAEEQTSYDILPKGTIAPVRMTIKPGGYDDPGQGWTGGYATRNETTGSIYLNAEFVLLEGPHARRRVWSLIGLSSPKGPEWANMGRSFVRGILNSARGLSEKDASPQAQIARRIDGLAVLDGIEFLAKIDVGKDQNGEPRNEIRFAVTPNHKDWQAFQQAGGQWRPGAAHAADAPPAQPYAPAATAAPQGAAPAPAVAPGAPQQPAQAPAAQPANPNRPAWAQ